MIIDGITRQALQALAIQTLIGANTAAEDRVFAPRDWPTAIDGFPLLMVQAPRERKVAIGRGAPQFNTTITLVVIGRVADYFADGAQAAIETLAAQVEDALLCATAFVENVQQFATVSTDLVVTSDGKAHIGEVGLTFDVEVYQLYAPNDGTPLTDISGTVTRADTGATLATFDAPLQG